MLKWTLIVLIGLVVLVGLVALIGLLLPKAHTAGSRARYQQPIDAVWAAITDFSAMPGWRPGIKKVERAADRNGHPVWVEIGKTGPMPLEVETLEPPRRMVLRIADDKLPFGGTWTYELAEADGGTILTITEDGEVYNPIFRFMSRTIFGHHKTLEDYLRALGKKYGEDIDIERLR